MAGTSRETFYNFVIWKFCNLKIAEPEFPPESAALLDCQIAKLPNYQIPKELHDQE
jgi:hypothetical protein